MIVLAIVVKRKRSAETVLFLCALWNLLTLPLSFFLPLAIKDLRNCGYSAPLAIAESLVRYYETSRLVRRAAQILIPLSIIAVPLYFVAIQPFTEPYKNSQMFFAQEILRVIEPKSQIYCLSSEEELAWVGQRYEGIQTLSGDDPSLVSQTLRNAGAGSYLVIGEKDYTSLLKHHEAIPGELVLRHKASHHEKMMLFRLGKRTSETP